MRKNYLIKRCREYHILIGILESIIRIFIKPEFLNLHNILLLAFPLMTIKIVPARRSIAARLTLEQCFVGVYVPNVSLH